ncbi:MAG: hypothetical protein RLY40_36 [Pseudomonadota bacterium]|jgi:hypothetical protein
MNLMSDSIKHIAVALSKAQSKIPIVKKNTQGHGYKYANIAEILLSISEPLREAELTMTQLGSFNEKGEPILVTLLMHSSGEWLNSVLLLKSQTSARTNEMQALGSGFTYLRRYAMSAMFGIAQEDDDGEKASPNPQTKDNKPKPASNHDENNFASTWVKRLEKLCEDHGIDVKEFANTHNVRSKDIETVKYAVEHFDSLRNKP